MNHIALTNPNPSFFFFSDFQILMYALEEISDLLRDISKCQKATKTALSSVSSAQIIVKSDDIKPASVANDITLPAACDFGFADKYSIDLPMKELSEFHEFEEMLKNDEVMRKDFVSDRFLFMRYLFFKFWSIL